MRLLFVADGRSTIARGWIDPFIEAGDEVHLATTFSCQPMEGLTSFEHIPVAFSGLKNGGSNRSGGGAAGIGWRTKIRHYAGPLTIPTASKRLAGLVDSLELDLVHALRVPFEGMMAAWNKPSVPLVISTWGNDFTLHAGGSVLMSWLTRKAMTSADGLHTDTQRDVKLARRWGFPADRPSVVLLTSGGLDPLFFNSEAVALPVDSQVIRLLDKLEPGTPLVVNPRGFRAYVRNDTFFESIPLVHSKLPEVVFACPMMESEPIAERWLADLSIGDRVHLLGRLSKPEMAMLLQRADIMVSPTEHDGTPNSMLESMASGAVPIAGDLESIREWIEDGENGLLINPANPAELASAILKALNDSCWRQKASKYNRSLAENRASRQVVFREARAFYDQMLEKRPVL